MKWQEKLAEANTLFEKIKKIETEGSDEEKANLAEMVEAYQELKAEALDMKGLEEVKERRKAEIKAEAAELASLDREAKAREMGAQDQEEDKLPEFKTWGEYLQAVHYMSHNRQFDPRLARFDDQAVKGEKQMVEGVGASGGFLVPAEFLAQMKAVMQEQAMVRPRATIIPMRRRELQIPVLDQTGTTAGIPHWFGGMQFYWEEEAAEKTLTEASFRQIKLVAHKLIGYTRASDELLDDSAISLEAFLAGPMGMGGGISWMEDYAFINGTGAGQPLGVITAGATITVARAATGAIGYPDLANMLENFLPSGRGVWFITQSAMADLVQLNGPAGNPSYIWGDAVQGVPGTLLGYPVVWTEKVPRIGTAGDVVLADWNYYLVGDRQATTVESTKFDYWRYDQTSWRAVHRGDGQPWLSAPLTYQDGTTQTSPFVILGDKDT